jgi:hypothetical protein
MKKIGALTIVIGVVALASVGCCQYKNNESIKTSHNNQKANIEESQEETTQEAIDKEILELYGDWGEKFENEGMDLTKKIGSLKEVDGKRVDIPISTTSEVNEEGKTIYHPKYENGGNGEVCEDYIIEEGAKYSVDGKKLLSAPLFDRDFTIMEGVETINISALTHYPDINFGIEPDPYVIIRSITLPESVKEIVFDIDWYDYLADYYQVSYIEKINIKSSKLSVDNISELLHTCGKVDADNIILPSDTVKYEDGMCIYKDYIVKYSGEDTEIEIPEGVKGIGDFAFTSFGLYEEEGSSDISRYKKNNYLEKIIIPGSVQTIGRGAFYNCKKLKTIEIKDGCKIKTIGEKAFKGTKVKEDKIIGR